MTLEQIREQLKDRRLYRVAQKTGLSYQTIRTIVTGANENPTLETMKALEAYLGQHSTISV